jgi:glycosyltransferase involved in cell wall biosynthesis
LVRLNSGHEMSTLNMVTFVIRTLNEASFLGILFDRLQEQANVVAGMETIVVDSGSTDGTVDIARARATRLVQIPKASFDYSAALNTGIAAGSGDIIVVLSAHAIPTSPHWLSLMLRPFTDSTVAGVYSRQVPWPDAHWRERSRLERMFPPQGRAYDASSMFEHVPFSNAASALRREVWAAHPFCLPAAEDVEWATAAVGLGWRIIYEAEVAVYHSHDEPPRLGARRLIDLERAADMQLARRRTLSLTAKQAVGAVVRDWPDICASASPGVARLRLLAESMARSYWFVRDFSRLTRSADLTREAAGPDAGGAS